MHPIIITDVILSYLRLMYYNAYKYQSELGPRQMYPMHPASSSVVILLAHASKFESELGSTHM